MWNRSHNAGVYACMRSHLLLAAISSLFTIACGPTVDLRTGLQVEAVSTGWFDAGIVDGKNKLVPTVSFALKNVSGEKLTGLQVNAVFRRASDPQDWGSGFRSNVSSEGLTPGAATGMLTLKSELGYTGTDSRDQMLAHTQFVDVTVDVFARYGSTQWARLGNYAISRRLIRAQ